MNRLCLGLVSLMSIIALSACQAPPTGGQALADQQTRVACQKRAEQAYDQQNRGAIYSPSSPVNTPYSANYFPESSEGGLSSLFAHEQMVSDCVRNTGTGAERSPSARQN